MVAIEPAKERIGRQLRKAIEILHDDIDRVEFWADALDHLAKPIPDYPVSDSVTRHLLPVRSRPSGEH